MTINNTDWRPRTNHPDFYQALEKNNIFTNFSYSFGIALALGYVVKKRSKEQPTKRFVETRVLVTYSNRVDEYPMFWDFINFVFDHYADGKDEKEQLKDLEKIAEGGIEFLMEQSLEDIPDMAKVIQQIKESAEQAST